MALDLLIRNGTIVDGSGEPRYQADIGIANGRIEAIGRIGDAATHIIDAHGLVVAPGFIDGHTHMDAQVAWDPLGQEMGSSLQTHLLSYWVRDKQAFTLEQGVRMLTHDNALAWAIADRGLLKTGYAADLVLFDEARIKPRMATVEHDLPGGSRRLVQKADGIAATIVNRHVVLEDGEPSGRHPGTVLEGRAAAA